jgi:hypothetical protein
VSAEAAARVARLVVDGSRVSMALSPAMFHRDSASPRGISNATFEVRI